MQKITHKTGAAASGLSSSCFIHTQKSLAAKLFGDGSATWDMLDDGQRQQLVQDLQEHLAELAHKETGVMCWTPPGLGVTQVLVAAPAMPFLADSILLAAQRCGAVVVTEGRLPVKGCESSPLYLALEALDNSATDALAVQVRMAVALTQAVLDDFPAMRERLMTLVGSLHEKSKAKEEDEAERLHFLEWLADNNFIFLGYRAYHFNGDTSDMMVRAVPNSGLGVLRTGLNTSRVSKTTPLSEVNGSLWRYVAEAQRGSWLQLSKTPEKSRVHRGAAMDYVGILETNGKGQPVCEHRFVGLYTSQAYTSGVHEIPLIRRKLDDVLTSASRASGWQAGSDEIRRLHNVLETFPRDELFLTPQDDLIRLATMMVRVHVRSSDVAVAARISPREQAINLFLFVPAVRYNSALRERIRHYLHEHLGGKESDFRLLAMDDSGVTRVLFKVRVPKLPDKVDETALLEGLRGLVRGWDDNLQTSLRMVLGAVPGQRLWQRYRQSVASVAYHDATPVGMATDDIINLHKFLGQDEAPIQVRVRTEPHGLSMRIFKRKEPLTLAQLLPVVNSFGLYGLTEQTFALPTPAGQVWLHVLACSPVEGMTEPVAAEVAHGLMLALQGELTNDSINSLTIRAALPLKAVHFLRAITSYLQQIDRRFDPGFVRRTLREHPALPRALWQLFQLQHTPSISTAKRKAEMPKVVAAVETAIAALPDSETDRIGRTLLQVIQACLRTNAWQHVSGGEALAFKLDSSLIDSLPSPRPWREIFVFHRMVEGVHLRGGPVARGGLRHSDRGTDYRTEVLALMAAQMRKNTIIVPVGSKGGFFVKTPLPSDRVAASEVVQKCYRMYIRALLSVTNTRVGSTVVPPRAVVRHDDDDPYLVVAADKGTATFSDLANDTALTADFWEDTEKKPIKGFWLGDAFASGGRHGYDHKKMGITARGAWVSVEHHLETLGIIPSPEQPLVAVGIGDMGGDVFGNGMMLSPHLKLVAAFNHKHIFIDPSPEPAASFAERKRLFDAVQGWDGYDVKKISAGGGVYLRSSKKITLEPDAQKLLGLSGASHTPDAIIRAILRADVNLLWNGGIGTYIKATSETHAAAADKTNDDVRVNASDVRAKIIGEGGNLGITPAGRVELALRGVRLNTDALDNSAGVSTSDHEVNLKILLALAQNEGRLDEKGRLALLPRLTDTMAELVLDDNTLQNMAITLEERCGPETHAELLAWQEKLIERGIASRTVDNLPDADMLAERPDNRYTRPELCGLLAATKAAIRSQIAGTGIVQAASVRPLLAAYFPKLIQEQFGDLLEKHPLADEIVSTGLCNLLANRCGLLMGQQLQYDFDCGPVDSIGAIVTAIVLLDAVSLWEQLDASTVMLDTRVAALMKIRQAISSMAGWVILQGLPVDTDAMLAHLGTACRDMQANMEDLLPPLDKADHMAVRKIWKAQGLSDRLATHFATLQFMQVVPDAAVLAAHHSWSLPKVMSQLLTVGSVLGLPSVMAHLRTMPLPDALTRQAVQAMQRELSLRQCRLAEGLMTHKLDVIAWQKAQSGRLKRYEQLRENLLAEPAQVVAATVLLSRLREVEAATLE